MFDFVIHFSPNGIGVYNRKAMPQPYSFHAFELKRFQGKYLKIWMQFVRKNYKQQKEPRDTLQLNAVRKQYTEEDDTQNRCPSKSKSSDMRAPAHFNEDFQSLFQKLQRVSIKVHVKKYFKSLKILKKKIGKGL